MFIEIILSVGGGSSSGLFQKDELCFQVAVMLTIDDWSLDGEVDAIHERFAVEAEISV